MDDYFAQYNNLLRIPPRPVRRPIQKPTFVLDQHEVMRQQKNILNSTVKTNALLAHIAGSRRKRTDTLYEEPDLSRLEPTVFVDELIQRQQQAREMASAIPSQKQLQRAREADEVSPEQLGKMVGVALADKKNDESQSAEGSRGVFSARDERISPVGARIIQGKMPVREMQEMTKNRIADLNAEQQYEKIVDYNSMMSGQELLARFVPAPDGEKSGVQASQLRQGIADMIMNGIPAELLVQMRFEDFYKEVQNSTFLCFGDLENIARIVQSEADDFQNYLYYAEPNPSDFYHKLYIEYNPKAFQKDCLLQREDFETTEQCSAEEAVKSIDAYYTEIQGCQQFSNQELAQFAAYYGRFFDDSLFSTEKALIESRQALLQQVLDRLARDSEFASVADAQATEQDQNMLKMQISQLQTHRIEYEARLQSVEAVEGKLYTQESSLLELFRLANKKLAASAAAELASTSLFRHPHQCLAWSNVEILEDFFVDHSISLEPDYCDVIHQNTALESFLHDGASVNGTPLSEEIGRLFKALQIDIHDKLQAFMLFTENFAEITKVIELLRHLEADKAFFDAYIAELDDQLTKFQGEQMRQHVKSQGEAMRASVLERKAAFGSKDTIPEFIRPQKIAPSEWYQFYAEKFSKIAGK